jgi:hypothetical protein
MILDKHMYLYRILQHASFMLFNAYITHILYLEEGYGGKKWKIREHHSTVKVGPRLDFDSFYDVIGYIKIRKWGGI